MALSASELSQVQNWLDYGNLTVLARPYFDIALVFADIVQNNLDSWGENYIRNTILPNLNQLDLDIMNCRTRFAADQVASVKRNPKELQDLLKVREFWIQRLEATTKVARAQRMGGGISGSGGGTIEVS